MLKEQGQKLLIDRVTPLQEPSEQQVAQWGRSQSIFISSTMVDLADARRTAESEIRRIGARPIMFESFGARTDDSRAAFLSEVRRSTIYMGILSERYGARLPSGYSATQEEYEEARKERKEILLFLDSGVPDSEREGHLNRWINELYQFHVVGKYRGPGGLSEAIRTSLTYLAGKQHTPWVKLGRLIFQATRIGKHSESGEVSVEVTTACRDSRIKSELSTAGQQFFGRAVQPLTFLLDSFPMEVVRVDETIDPSGRDSVIISCKKADRRFSDQGPDPFLQWGGSYQSQGRTYSHQDLVLIAARAVVLGEEPPHDPFLRSTEPTDFRALFEACGADLHVFPQVCRLVTTEKLVGRGMVGHLLDLSFESVQRGQMRVRIAATLPQLYSNRDPQSIELEGLVQF